jgi:hypothetical protein
MRDTSAIMRFLILIVSLLAMLAADVSSLQAQSMTVGPPTVDANGVKSYPVWSIYQGSQQQIVRVLEPTAPAAGQRRRLLYVLPVLAGVTDLTSSFSDGLEELRLLDVPNRYNMTLIAPSFNYEPWYGDNVLDPTMLMESFVVKDLVPWGDTFAPGTQRFLIGFSKSGNGSLTLIFRNPNVFNAAAAWDAPAQLNDLSAFAGLPLNFGTQANFDLYYIPSLVTNDAAPFLTQNRLWISGDQAAWTSDMFELNDQLTAALIPHTWVAGGVRAHSWGSGWLDGAVSTLDAFPDPLSSTFSGIEDPLSENGMWDTPGSWSSLKKNDGVYSTSMTAGARLVSPVLSADQYAEITYDQDPGSSSWVGVMTRVQGKSNGSDYLAIAYAGQVRLYRTDDAGSLNFTLLASANASVGTAPRQLRLESQGSTHRVYFNGVLALSFTDGTYTSGQPGIAAAVFGGPTVKILSFIGGALTGSDITPPVRTNGKPTGGLASGTTQTNLSLTTDENATCRYATTAGVAYGSMPNTFASTGATTHSTPVTGLADGGTYNYYVRCQDTAGNASPDDFLISFTVVSNGTASSTFSGMEDPLSENGMWDTPGSWSTLKKNNGAYSTNITSGARLVSPVVSADQYTEITYDQDPGSSSWVGVMTRVQGKTNGSDYLAIAYAGQVRLYRTDDTGSLNFTQLAAANASVGTAPRQLRLESQGSTHRIYFNGALALSFTDGTYTSGQPGIAAAVFGGPTMKILSFVGGALTVSGTTPPVRSNGQPTGVLASGTTQTNLSLATDENATCRYATTAGVTYGSMPNTFANTGATAHSTVVTGLVDGGTYNYYARCQDTAGNANPDDFVISFSVASSVRVSSVTLSPTSVLGGSSSTGTVTLSGPAPSSGATVVLSTSDNTIATVPASITIPANATSATFAVTTSPVATTSSVSVSASYTNTSSSTLTVTAAALSSVTLSPTSVRGGTSSTGTVTLNGPAPAAGAQIALASNNSPVANVPSSVIIAANATTATFVVSTSPVATDTAVSITASYATGTKAATLTVTAATLSSVTVSPTSVRGGSSSTGTVTLNGPSPANGALVTLSTSNSSVAPVPASVTVASGATTATFLISTTPVGSNTSVTISGVYGSITRNAILTVTAATLSSVALSPTSVLGGSSSKGTVTLNGPAPAAGALVTLSSTNTGVATVPNSVTIGSGATTATFNVTTAAVAAKTSVTISATYGTTTRTTSLTVTAAVLTSVTVSPTSVTGGTQAIGTVTLTGPAPPLGATVSLNSNNATIVTVPSTVTIPANMLSASFAITTAPVTATKSVTVSAKYGGGTQKATLTVTPSVGGLKRKGRILIDATRLEEQKPTMEYKP